jgi:hypothetical protein
MADKKVKKTDKKKTAPKADPAETKKQGEGK